MKSSEYAHLSPLCGRRVYRPCSPWLIGKLLVDFLLVTLEIFLQDVTDEVL